MCNLLESDLSNCVDFDESRYPAIDANTLRENNRYLHQMLPYDLSIKTKKDLKTGLQEYAMLLQASLEAIDYYIAKRFQKFDGLVGDAACQIRAVQMALIIKKNLVDFTLARKQITQALTVVNELLQEKMIQTLIKSGISMQQLIEQKNLFIELSPEEVFLFRNFILTETKEESVDKGSLSQIMQRASPQNLDRFGISNTFALKFVRKQRKYLSIESVQFIRQSAKSLGNKDLEEMVSEKYTMRNNNCACIPTFWTFKTLFQTLLDEKIPMIFHVSFLKRSSDGDYSKSDETFLIYQPENQSGDVLFFEKKLSEFNLNSPAIVFEAAVFNETDGFSKQLWKDSIKQHYIQDVILEFAAAHRQYPDPEFDGLFDETENYEYHAFKKLAVEHGFTYENPSSLVCSHVYAAIPENLEFFS